MEARKETAALRPHLPGGTACASCPQAPELFLPADVPWEDGPPGNREAADPHDQSGYSLELRGKVWEGSGHRGLSAAWSSSGGTAVAAGGDVSPVSLPGSEGRV